MRAMRAGTLFRAVGDFRKGQSSRPIHSLGLVHASRHPAVSGRATARAWCRAKITSSACRLHESKGMIKDRICAARESTMAEPRTLRHFITNVRILEAGDEAVLAEANVLVVQTMINRMTEIVLSGFYLDRIVRSGDRLRFKERLCIYDSLLLPTSLIGPV
jgi:3-phenylpropionate/cinnamic acid dioxygenase small subunit